MELIQNYEDATPEPRASQECRKAFYSKDGSRFAYTQPDGVYVFDTKTQAELAVKIEMADVMDIMFSPRGLYVVIWCKPVCLDRALGQWNNNVKLYNISTQLVVGEWLKNQQNGWMPQFTADELMMARGGALAKEIHVFEITTATKELGQPLHRYKANDPIQLFQVSPGRNPAMAVFIPEQGGKPGLVCVYNIPSFNQPICLKNFFKADRCQLKWNSLGTALLALALTDHDSTNQLYYGETTLYLLGIAGLYDLRITLDKEGPIHDITWSPTGREFAVLYGFMPSLTMFFDARGNAIHMLPMAPRNTILYLPQARYVLVAGFGNLQGTVDVYDRQNKFEKVVTFQAPNTSVCEWSPCGRFILTATTAPRLRVDNGFKVWHALGSLIYLKDYPELNQIGWKPQDLNSFPPLKELELAPAPLPLAQEWLSKRAPAPETPRPAGAYRPPHARRSGATATTSSLYEKEQASLRSASASPAAGGRVGVNPTSGRPRVVPGAAPVGAAKKKNNKKPAKNGSELPAPAPEPAVDGVDTPSSEEKKIRSLLKKLRAIEQLKAKQANGEFLEDTQVAKIKKEGELRSELATLGWSE